MPKRLGNTQIPSAAGLSDIINLKQHKQYVEQDIFPSPDNDVLSGLRFDSSSYLTRTPTAAGNRKTWTWSGWVKRSSFTEQFLFGVANSGSDSTYQNLQFQVGGKLQFSNWTGSINVRPAQILLDPSSWYHIIVKVDTTQATASERLVFYVNGNKITDNALTNYPSPNEDLLINTTVTHQIGARLTAGAIMILDGYLANIHFIDGQALDPSHFGYYNRSSRQWKPKKYTGTYGGNGFYLPMKTDKYMARFNGTNTQITGGNFNTNNILSNTPFTIAFWVRQKTGFANDRFVSATSNGGTSDGFFIRSMTSAGSPASSSYNMDITLDQTSGGRPLSYFPWKVEVGEWSFVTLTWDGTTTSNKVIAYVNGAVNNTGTAGVAKNTVTHTYNFKLGANASASSSFYDGSLAQYAIWHRELTSQEVSDLYNLGITGNLSSIHNGDLQVYYTLNNVSTYATKDTTTIVNDRSTNNINLAPQNFSSFPMINAGYDESPNHNDWDTIGAYHYDGTADSPQNTFATLNPLDKGSSVTISNGNLFVSTTSNLTNFTITRSNILFPKTGLYYFECYFISSSNGGWFGIDNAYDQISGNQNGNNNGTASIGRDNNSFFYLTIDSINIGEETHTSGTVIPVVWDADTNTIYTNHGVPSSSSLGSYTYSGVISSVTGDFFPIAGPRYTTTDFTFNFGQDPTFGGEKSPSTTYTDANGIGSFYYQPPDGALALCTANLSRSVIEDPADYFKAVTWDGDNGNPRSITSVNFKPDLVWLKNRTDSVDTGSNNLLFDSLRGATKYLQSDQTDQEETNVNSLISFDNNGFTIGNLQRTNSTGKQYVAWCWKAGGAPSADDKAMVDGVESTITGDAKLDAGTITPTRMSVNTKSGFSIISYTGDNQDSTLPHGLNSSPEMIIVKQTSGSGGQWYTWHKGLTGTNNLRLNENVSTFGTGTGGNIGKNVNLNTFGFNQGSSNFSGPNGVENYIAYCWHSVPGYSMLGTYTGNGSTDGPFVYLGFRPAFFIIKTTGTEQWAIIDTARYQYNDNTAHILFANRYIDEDLNANYHQIDILSNGFKVRGQNQGLVNGTNYGYIFMAFAEQPFNFTNSR